MRRTIEGVCFLLRGASAFAVMVLFREPVAKGASAADVMTYSRKVPKPGRVSQEIGDLQPVTRFRKDGGVLTPNHAPSTVVDADGGR
jgi:hypothetical protein